MLGYFRFALREKWLPVSEEVLHNMVIEGGGRKEA